MVQGQVCVDTRCVQVGIGYDVSLRDERSKDFFVRTQQLYRVESNEERGQHAGHDRFPWGAGVCCGDCHEECEGGSYGR